MHVSIDLSSHKLVTVPPSRPGDSNLMVAQILGLIPLHQTTLLKSRPHKETSTLTGPWGYSLSPFRDWNGPGWWVLNHIFPFPMCLERVQRSLSFHPEVCRRNNVEFHNFRWNGELWWAGLAGTVVNGSRKKTSCSSVCMRGWGATIPLFIGENKWHHVGSISRHWAHSLTADFLTSWGLRIGCLQLFGCWALYCLGSSYPF